MLVKHVPTGEQVAVEKRAMALRRSQSWWWFALLNSCIHSCDFINYQLLDGIWEFVNLVDDFMADVRYRDTLLAKVEGYFFRVNLFLRIKLNDFMACTYQLKLKFNISN